MMEEGMRIQSGLRCMKSKACPIWRRFLWRQRAPDSEPISHRYTLSPHIRRRDSKQVAAQLGVKLEPLETMYPWECRRKRPHLTLFSTSFPHPARDASPAALTHSAQPAVETSSLLSQRCITFAIFAKLTSSSPGGPKGPFWGPPTLFVRFVQCRAKTDSLRIIAVSRNLFMGRTPSFSLAQTLYRVRGLLPTSPSHRHCCGCPPIPLLC
jgi:hypothetical protein